MSNRAGAGRGFTLIELLVTMVIVAILATIAYPSYQAHVRRSYRSVAQQFLVDMVNREQQYLMDARAYGTLAQLGVTAPSDVSTRYTVSVALNNAATPPTFTITATPVAGASQAADGELTINSTGVKTPADKW